MKLLSVSAWLTTAAVIAACSAPLCAYAAGSEVAAAARSRQYELVRSLLKEKKDVNAPLPDGVTALHWAVLNGDVKLANLLLGAGANPKTASRVDGISPLYTAAQIGSPVLTRTLLKAGADANTANTNGTTPLMVAAASGSVDTVRELLDHGAKIDAVDTVNGQSALMFAAAKDRADVIRYLIGHGANHHATSTVVKLGRQQFDDDGNPIGGDAAGGARGQGRRRRPGGTAGGANGSGEGAPARPANANPLLSDDIFGGDEPAPRPTRGTASAGDTTKPAAPKPAEEAAANPGGGQPAVGFGQRPANTSAGGARPAGFAAAAGRRASAITRGGNTALILAAREGNLSAVQALVGSKAEIDQPNAGDKTTPLLAAICNGHFDVAKFLLDYGASANQPSIDGLTPLYAVIDTKYAPQTWTPNPDTDHDQTSYTDLIKALIDKGANVNAKLVKKLWFRPTHHDECWVGTAGSTPFWRAAQALDLSVMKLLIAHGADPKVSSDDGDNALMVAAGLGWNGNFTIQAATPAVEVIKYCLQLGLDPKAQDAQGYTAIGGAAYRGDIDTIKLLVAAGARLDTRNQRGWSVTDMANGPSLRSSVPVKHPEAVSLLLKLGAPALTPTDDEEILGIIRRKVSQPSVPASGEKQP